MVTLVAQRADPFLPAETHFSLEIRQHPVLVQHSLPPARASMLVTSVIRFSRGTFDIGVLGQIRQSSSKRWQARQHKDQFTREAAVQGLKSRAAFKLLQV